VTCSRWAPGAPSDRGAEAQRWLSPIFGYHLPGSGRAILNSRQGSITLLLVRGIAPILTEWQLKEVSFQTEHLGCEGELHA
jgi:hypothetical protein